MLAESRAARPQRIRNLPVHEDEPAAPPRESHPHRGRHRRRSMRLQAAGREPTAPSRSLRSQRPARRRASPLAEAAGSGQAPRAGLPPGRHSAPPKPAEPKTTAPFVAVIDAGTGARGRDGGARRLHGRDGGRDHAAECSAALTSRRQTGEPHRRTCAHAGAVRPPPRNRPPGDGSRKIRCPCLARSRYARSTRLIPPAPRPGRDPPARLRSGSVPGLNLERRNSPAPSPDSSERSLSLCPTTASTSYPKSKCPKCTTPCSRR